MGFFRRGRRKATAADVYEGGTPFDEQHERSERSEFERQVLDPSATKPLDEEYSGD